MSSGPDGSLAVVAFGYFHGSQELKYSHGEADGFLNWICQMTEVEPFENQKLQETEAQVRVSLELGLLQLLLSVHIVYLPGKPQPAPYEGTQGWHRPPSVVAVPVLWWARLLLCTAVRRAVEQQSMGAVCCRCPRG